PQGPVHSRLVEALRPLIANRLQHFALVADVHVADPLTRPALERKRIAREVTGVEGPVQQIGRCAFDGAADRAERMLLVQALHGARPVATRGRAVFEDRPQTSLAFAQPGGAPAIVELVLPRGRRY